MGLIPRSGKRPREGNSDTIQYSYLENSMGRGAWRATVHGVPKSWTQLNDWAPKKQKKKQLIDYKEIFLDKCPLQPISFYIYLLPTPPCNLDCMWASQEPFSGDQDPQISSSKLSVESDIFPISLAHLSLFSPPNKKSNTFSSRASQIKKLRWK